MAVSANKLELLQIADAVAREKAIDRSIVIGAMEDAIAKAARSRYGAETDVHAEINSKTGELRLSRHMLVVDSVENSSNQISMDEARKRNPAAQVGDTIADTLPPLEYGRIAAQSAKQVIVQKVREAERDRQYQEYKDRIGDIVSGIVKDAHGDILPNIIVEVKDQTDNPVRAFKTNKLGQFSASTSLANGHYTIFLEDPKDTYQFEVIAIELTGSVFQPLEIMAKDVEVAKKQNERQQLHQALFGAKPAPSN